MAAVNWAWFSMGSSDTPFCTLASTDVLKKYLQLWCRIWYSSSNISAFTSGEDRCRHGNRGGLGHRTQEMHSPSAFGVKAGRGTLVHKLAEMTSLSARQVDASALKSVAPGKMQTDSRLAGKVTVRYSVSLVTPREIDKAVASRHPPPSSGGVGGRDEHAHWQLKRDLDSPAK